MMAIRNISDRVLFERVSIAPLVTFRVLFGLVMLVSTVRFWSNGWIETQYISPSFHFKYFGFNWVPEVPDVGYYLIFFAMGVSALCIALGAFYRIASIAFFVLFTYIELVDATFYLNHYYFVSLMAIIMVFLPAHRSRSVDVWLERVSPLNQTAAGNINIIKFQLALVYFFAGIAKLNADWLFDAMPLAIWLPAQDQLPLVGGLLQFSWSPYLFSWAGALYDLSIPFLLLLSQTRLVAYVAVIVFHLFTWSLFQIGMFPFIMIGATLIFFSEDAHIKWQHKIFGKPSAIGWNTKSGVTNTRKNWITTTLAVFVLFQLTFPFRHVLYDGNVFWHEQGYRFGWRVMLIEKAGYAQFIVEDDLGRQIEVQNSDFLTPVQEKMMSTQPDFMLQYAHFLETHYRDLGIKTETVKANVFVSLNGQGSRRLIDPEVNLSQIKDSWKEKDWILPYKS